MILTEVAFFYLQQNQHINVILKYFFEVVFLKFNTFLIFIKWGVKKFVLDFHFCNVRKESNLACILIIINCRKKL